MARSVDARSVERSAATVVFEFTSLGVAEPAGFVADTKIDLSFRIFVDMLPRINLEHEHNLVGGGPQLGYFAPYDGGREVVGGLEELVHPTGCYPIDRAVVNPNGNVPALGIRHCDEWHRDVPCSGAPGLALVPLPFVKRGQLQSRLGGREGKHAVNLASLHGNYCNIFPVQISLGGVRWTLCAIGDVRGSFYCQE